MGTKKITTTYILIIQDVHSQNMGVYESLLLKFGIPKHNIDTLKFTTYSYGVQILYVKV